MAEPHDAVTEATGFMDMTGGTSLEHLPFNLGHAITETLELMAMLIDLFGVGLILFGFFVALLRLLGSLHMGAGLRHELSGINRARTTLAAYILTGLEFMIASDIIHTVITREFTDLIFVGLLVLIRTAISFFLGKEVMELDAHSEKPPV